MSRKKSNNSLGEFHKKVSDKGLTYAEAQMRESREIMGRIRKPNAEEYMSVSSRNLLKKCQKS